MSIAGEIKKILVTGGAGFIGSNFVHHILATYPDWAVTNLDKLTYAGNLQNLKDVQNYPRYRFIKGDISDSGLISKVLEQGFDVIVNFAAESHVDRSIMDSSPFIRTNIQGTQVLLEGARQHRVKLFLQVSTDEVYGSLSEGKFTEESPLLPNSPYAASKAAADCLCRAYFHTYCLPVITTRCGNNYGPFQFPEKLIPLLITNAIEGREIPVYGDGMNIRDWIHVTDHCRALVCIIRSGEAGEIYNIGSHNETTNLEIVQRTLGLMGKPQSLIKFVVDRPGHDRRYALDTIKIEETLGWKPGVAFKEGLKHTIDWYVKNESWWRSIKSGKYNEYYDRWYGQREEA